MSGYSGKPLWEKLGLKAGMRAGVVNPTGLAAPAYWRKAPFDATLTEMAAAPQGGTELDFLHLFVTTRAELSVQAARLLPALAKTGIWWVSWPKKASGRGSDITEDVVRDVLLPLGVVDIKVCSVTDELWSGLKWMWRKSLR